MENLEWLYGLGLIAVIVIGYISVKNIGTLLIFFNDYLRNNKPTSQM